MRSFHSNSLSPGTVRVGIDIGRVLMCPADDDGRPDTSFLHAPEAEALAIPPAPHAFDVIRELVDRFGGNVWLVSKAGPRIQSMTLRWLEHQRFYAQTSVPPTHVRFCRERAEKRLHAVKLRLSHFIDDRLDVLAHLRGVVAHLYLFGAQRAPAPDWGHPVRDWTCVRAALLGRR